MTQLIVDNVSQKVTVKSHTVEILKDVSFTVGSNEFVAVVGPSGSGKTTLGRIIAGLEKPASGKVILDGLEVNQPTEKISVVFQSFGLLPWKTALENIELALMGKPEIQKKKIALHFLNMVGLDGFEDHYPDELSGSMRQRVGLARALASDPRILIMDEPFSSLDRLTRIYLEEQMKEIMQNPTAPPDSIIMLTHDVEEAVMLATRVIVLSNRPGMIKTDTKIEMPLTKRDRKKRDFRQLVDFFTSIMTS
ncbi:MAG: ABC transporter ATP-binding protein [Candidatus Anstonellales archaeon]